ncbi:MAG TPA: thiamine pyrophosphate-dependent dehydrogenase E1 component subunit alpha [Candidatus Polarisedimenticolia bacterium]|nr:thiamine pyrophosphate-dependent dehydrogenase E1 component subunit alpha [Candidatus Polarisedimenticolia bacterium]
MAVAVKRTARSAPAGADRSRPAARDFVPDDAALLRMLYFMKQTRALEDRIERKLYRQGKIVGGVYVGRGQEAISVGAAMHIRRTGNDDVDDIVSPSHRDMAVFLMQGVTPERILSQYMGRRTGLTRGRDGNMHMGDLQRRLVAFISHLGDSIPVAAGCAMTFRMRRTDQVSFCFFGEGAASRGDWHEGVNFAAVRRLPVVFICNNNQYAYSTHVSRQMAVKHLSERAPGYGLPGETADGNDVLEVYDTVGRAVRRARAGEGPSLLEFETFRMTGHSAHDDAGYVPRQLFQEWARRDPIARLTRVLEERRLIDAPAVREMEGRIEAEIDAAVDWAEAQPLPDPAEAGQGVYAGT